MRIASIRRTNCCTAWRCGGWSGSIRDAILAVSAERRQAVWTERHAAPDGIYGRPGRPKESGPLDGDGRRSIYLGVRRNFLSPMLLAFDYPIPFTTIGRAARPTFPRKP